MCEVARYFLRRPRRPPQIALFDHDLRAQCFANEIPQFLGLDKRSAGGLVSVVHEVKTYKVAMHHREMIAWQVSRLHLGDIQKLIPPIRTKVCPVVQKEERMAGRIRIRPRVRRQLADAVLAPDRHHARTFVVGYALSSVVAQCCDRCRKMRK